MKNIFKMIQTMISGKEVFDFSPSEAQKEILIDWFISRGRVFNKDTPKYITTCPKCIESSLKIDFNSANYLPESIPLDYQEKIIEFLLSKPFVLNNWAPPFLAKNYQIASNSIHLDSSSANYVSCFCFNSHELEKFISELIETDYVLTRNGPMEFRLNHDIVLSSIKNNISSIAFVSYDLRKEKDIFEYLLFHDGCTFGDVKDVRLDQLLNPTYIYPCFKVGCAYLTNSPSYIYNFNSLFQDLFHSRITIQQCDSIFQNFLEKAWKNYRSENTVICDNIFGKICAELKRNPSFDSAILNLVFLTNMSDVLGEKYDALYSAMTEYYSIVHSNLEDKYENLEKSRDTIAYLSALYVSKIKENYKKKIFEQYHKNLQPYFCLRNDNLGIQKLIIYQRQKEKFKNLYQSMDSEISKFILSLKSSYSELMNPEGIEKLIDNFVSKETSKIQFILEEPTSYQRYLNSKKVMKLVHRLNSHYISIDGPEAFNYRDFIEYDSSKGEYYSLISEFMDDELKECVEYDRKKQIFKNIKRDITNKIKSLDVDSKFDYSDIKKLSLNIPFNDDYYVFDIDNVLKLFCINDLYHCIFMGTNQNSMDAFLFEDIYNQLHQILIDDGYLWFRLILSKACLSKDERKMFYDFCKSFVPDLMNNMSSISYFIELFHMDIHNYEQLSLLLRVELCVDMKAMAILDEHLIKTLSKELSHTGNHTTSEIISAAERLVCSMITKDRFTVPRVHGETLNYKYSMYDQQDLSVLLSGINTGACFKICGNDNDFFHYCMLDKNGFVIKIEDFYGNFIARAGGFRHGNCVFVNQLRTIYDNSEILKDRFDAEGNEIIEAFEKACDDIVTTSQNNNQEENKIDYVFVTNGYILRNYKCNVSPSAIRKIGSYPMDSSSEDWKNFLSSTENLSSDISKRGFTTDYGYPSLICIASKDEDFSSFEDINFYDAPIAYQRSRNSIIVSDQPNDDIFRKVNRIRAINLNPDERDFEFLKIPNQAVTVLGDNWYIICDSNHIVDSCVLEKDSHAKLEFDAVNSILKEEMNRNNGDLIDINQLISLFESRKSIESNKLLIKNYSVKKN